MCRAKVYIHNVDDHPLPSLFLRTFYFLRHHTKKPHPTHTHTNARTHVSARARARTHTHTHTQERARVQDITHSALISIQPLQN